MIEHKNESKVKRIVIGYTLDAVLTAHNLAMDPDNDVEFYCTGELGEPLDKYNDFISYDNAQRIDYITHGTPYEGFSNVEYMYIPYDKLKFKNSHNGLIQLPFNKMSFDDIDEWKAVVDGFNSTEVQNIMSDASNSPTRLITMYKQYLPKWFVDSIIRNVSPTRWADIPTSALTLIGFNYEFNLSKIDSSSIEQWYKPTISFKNVCENILKTDNIPIYYADKSLCYNFLTDRNIPNVTFMDNRVDYYLDYRFGMFDRCAMTYERIDKMPDGIDDIDNGVIKTPTMEYWAISKYKDDVRKLYCTQIKKINDIPVSDIPMTKNNLRIYDAYSKMLPLYGVGKTLNLQQKIKTLIK